MKYINKLLPRKRSRMTKRILGFLAIFALSGLFFQTNVGMSEVQAQTPTGTVQGGSAPTTIDKMWLVELFDLILKVIYILLWPLLVVAGWAMDNTLIYGSLFHLDVPLWKFRNILKNFTNFALWFMVLFAILKSIFTNSEMWTLKDGKSPLGIIKKTLIAGILIQASRFLVAAAVDVSTVATYAVGWLPLSVLKNTDLGQRKILAVDANLDLNKVSNLNNQWDILSLTYSAGPHKLSACMLSNNNGSCIPTTGNDCSAEYRYIVGRKVLSGTEAGKCVFGGNMVMFYNETWLQSSFTDPVQYTQFITNKARQTDATIKTFVEKWYIVDIYSGWSFQSSQGSWATWFASTPSMMLSELVTRSKWFVWPMVTIYSSLLNFAEISDTWVSSFGKVSGEMIIRTAFALMLFFPLLALAVVLIIRIWFLWLVIAASPFVVLAETFKDTIKLPEALKKHFDLSNILSVIFAPVVTVFALSLAVIFITTLINTFTPKTATPNSNVDTTITTGLEPTIQKLPSNGWSQKYLVWGSQMTLTNFNRWGSLDRFSWIIVNLVSVGLMRALVFAAIKANSLGKSFAAPIEKFGTGFMSTLPIFNTPWGKAGVGTIGSGVKDIVWDGNTPGAYIQNKLDRDRDVVTKFIEEKFPTPGAENRLTTEKINSIIAAKPTTPEAAKEALTAQWVTDFTAAVTNGWTAIYNAIMKWSTDEKERAAMGKSIWEAANKPTWRDDMVKADATTKFEELVKIENKDVDPQTIQKILDDNNNKSTIELFFKTNPEWYKKTFDKTTFTITLDGTNKKPKVNKETK